MHEIDRRRSPNPERPAGTLLACTYLCATDELTVSSGRTGSGVDEDLGQGLLVCLDQRDGRFLGLTLRGVREHLGAASHEEVEALPEPGASDQGFVQRVELLVGHGDGSVSDVIELLLRITGLRIREV